MSDIETRTLVGTPDPDPRPPLAATLRAPATTTATALSSTMVRMVTSAQTVATASAGFGLVWPLGRIIR